MRGAGGTVPALALVVVGALLVAPAAPADGAGMTTIDLSRAAAETVGGRDGRVELPVTGGEAGAVARLEHRGAIRFRAGGKRARARDVSVVLADTGSHITARIGGTQSTLIRLRGAGPGDWDPLTGEVAVRGARARLGGDARRALRRELGGARLAARLGRVWIHATVDPAPAPQAEPPVATRPAGAVDVTAATVTWRARESWVDYLHAAGDAGGTAVSGGATDGPAEVVPPSSEPRVYEFGYPFASGWFDPASGHAAVYFAGTVNFHKLIDPFQIDLDAQNAEIELTGEPSRAIFLLNGRRNNADQQNRRAVAVDLDPAVVTPTVTSAGASTTYAYERVPATVPEGATAWPIAGFYTPGSPWGSVSISFTVGEAAP